MSPARVNRIVAGLLADKPDVRSLPDRLCAACLDLLPMTGVGLALMGDDGHKGVVSATDGPARLMEDLQFTLGEGPCIDASSSGQPVLQPHLAASGPQRWPMFSAAVIEAGVAAIFAIPLQVGAIRLGVLDLYSTDEGNLSDEDLAVALAFADAAVIVLLHLQDQMGGADDLHPHLADDLGWHPAIHQATGIISVQAVVGLVEALLILRARAYSEDRPILKVAREVVTRRLTFHPDSSTEEK